MKSFFTTLFVCVAISAATPAWAQVHPQVIVANGGVFGPGNTVRIATWDLLTDQYTVFDSFPASSVQHVSCYERHAVVCADSFLTLYDLDTYQRLEQVKVSGVRQAKILPNHVIVSKGYGAQGDWVEFRHRSDLSLDFSIPGISGECEGIAVYNDSVYVGVPVGFGASMGKIAVISLTSQSLVREIDLGPNGRLIRNLYLHGSDLYSVNQIDYFSNHGYISAYNIQSATLQHHRVDMPTSLGGGIHLGKLHANFGAGLGAWSLQDTVVTDTMVVPGYWAAMAMDTVLHRYYVTATDYATWGRLYQYDLLGNLLDSTDIGVSPEAIAVDAYVITANPDANEKTASLRAYPVPFGDRLTLDLRDFPAGNYTATLLNLQGQQVSEIPTQGLGLRSISTADLPAGLYLLRLSNGKRQWTLRVVKE